MIASETPSVTDQARYIAGRSRLQSLSAGSIITAHSWGRFAQREEPSMPHLQPTRALSTWDCI
jgi:hypothetical protein